MKLLSCFVLVLTLANLETKDPQDNLLVVTIATEETHGFKRYVRSLKLYDYQYEVYGLGQEWRGGNIKKNTGGGQKINILVKELEKYKNDEHKIIVFTDSYDVIFAQKPSALIEKFKAFDANVVFGAEDYCWPDHTLVDDYPRVELNEKRFLNSGGFIGYASSVYEIISTSEIKDDDDDQLFYTKIFLNKPTRDSIKIKLDTKSNIFQNLNGASHEISLFAENDDVFIYNNVTETVPIIVHGNGGSKMVLNRVSNYIGKAFSNSDGCVICHEDKIVLPENHNEWPDLTVGIFIEDATPFIREFFDRFTKLNYPKEKMTLLIHNNIKYHTKLVENFSEEHKSEYHSIKYIASDDDSPEHEARTEAIQECVKNNCKYYFSLDSTVHLDNPDTIKLLIEQNRDVLSPIMLRKYSTWSNVWGDVSELGFYARSDDYLDIINRKRLGVFNLAHVSEAILMKGELLKKVKISFEDVYLDAVMAFSANLREKDIFMYATNMDYFGHLVNPDSFNTSLIRPEMFQIIDNFDDWVSRYINPEYYDFLSGKSEVLLPCPDVYWFPVVKEEFCDDLITMMEDFGKWSGGRNNNQDERLPGGYENVPTVDIHMTQVGWNDHWLYFLRKFIQPMQQKVFIGYFHDPPNAHLNFVVRYRVGEQENLKPHHDASTYTLNVALNKPQVDYQGGGCRFVRYNCSVVETKKGWAMIHPGRLTHYHEGLKVSGGTRYIMVSFIDP